MTVNELFESELCNLYALNKQGQNTFSSISVSFLEDRYKIVVDKIKKQLINDAVVIDKCINDNSLNPTNTKDNVAEEIFINIAETVSKNIEDSVKTKGLHMSLNRFLYYVLANLENIALLSDEKEAKPIIQLINSYKTIHNELTLAY